MSARRAENSPIGSLSESGKRWSVGLQVPEIIPLKFRTDRANVGGAGESVKQGPGGRSPAASAARRHEIAV